MEPLVPSAGWGVTHLYYRARPGLAGPAGARKQLLAAIDAFAGNDRHQVLTSTVLGAKADLGVMAIGPDLRAHDALARSIGTLTGTLEPVFSYFSLTETSEYMATVEQTRARMLAEHGPEGLDERMAEAAARLDKYRNDKLYPLLPVRPVLAFYPMSKAREQGANWYKLPFEDRRRLMSGRAAVGRRYAGRILQRVTASTGLDDWEWGVTLLADDIAAVKEIVYEMRFDEVTADYGRFGPFFAGLTCPPEELPERLGL